MPTILNAAPKLLDKLADHGQFLSFCGFIQVFVTVLVEGIMEIGIVEDGWMTDEEDGPGMSWMELRETLVKLKEGVLEDRILARMTYSTQ